ncbi:MAG: metal-sensing transcriptional repressor [Luteitalea sp.]|nr:metal-sensing transcriptional repressor [Luteitalea sp.]
MTSTSRTGRWISASATTAIPSNEEDVNSSTLFPAGRSGTPPNAERVRIVTMDEVATMDAIVSRSETLIDESHQQNLIARLKRVEGQVRGIRRMVQEPRLCIEILQQLAAAEAAINRISLAVLRYHVDHCVPEGVALGGEEQRKRLTELVDIFDRFAR